MRAIERAAAVVRRGGVVAIPTDALYALVCDPLNLHAVGSIFGAKGRSVERALPLLVSDVVMAEELAKEVSARFYMLAHRQAECKVATALLERLNQPLVSTSANISGQPTLSSGSPANSSATPISPRRRHSGDAEHRCASTACAVRWTARRYSRWASHAASRGRSPASRTVSSLASSSS